MFMSTFWRNAFERCVKTFAQTAAALIAVDQATPAAISWQQVLIGAGVAALLSLLTSVASAPVGPQGSPSLTEDPNAADL